MTRAKSGRPPKGQVRVQREDILKGALEILDSAGPQGLSMRALARHLKINPMTLYHHAGDRSEILRAVSDLVYGDVAKRSGKSAGSVRDQIETLLTDYHQAVKRHPQLSLSIFSTPDAFSEEAQRITHQLIQLLGAANLSRAKARVWLAILVDYTHGSSLALAMNGSSNRRGAKAQSDEYLRGLAELLDCLFSG